jgi:hypothetical protein
MTKHNVVSHAECPERNFLICPEWVHTVYVIIDILIILRKNGPKRNSGVHALPKEESGVKQNLFLRHQQKSLMDLEPMRGID